MSALLVDTSAYSAFKRGHSDALTAIQAASRILIPVIVLGELLAGFSVGTQLHKNQDELHAFLQSGRVRVMPIKLATAERYATIYAFLRQAGQPIPTNDLWIAASAMEYGATLLTADAHFQQVPQILVDFLS
jgi:tRNA(fMet)-specific endonuclease VapC